MTEMLLPLDHFGTGDIAVAGGKGANLGELIGTGLPVPKGFVITTEAYRSVAADDPALRPGDDPGDGTAIRAAWEQVRLPSELAARIRSSYRSLGGDGDARVAVRSSATAEDLAGAAFAGQQDTFLDVVGEDELINAVRRCWASLWTERAIAYRAERGFSGEVAIAVVVQLMVPASVAGVLFTADPVTGARTDMIIDASPGLGEAVVSGLVTPEHYRLGPDAEVLEHQPGRRETVIGDRTTAAASGELSPAALRRLHRLGRQIQDHYRQPMDIEWAISSTDDPDRPPDGVWVVQARPLTGLPAEPVSLSPQEQRISTIVGDYLGVRPYPLDMTTWFEHGPLKWVADQARSVGVRLDIQHAFPERDGVVQGFRPPHPRPRPSLPAAPLLILGRVIRYECSRWRNDRRYLDYRRRLDQLAARDPARLAWPDLLAHTRLVLESVHRLFDLRVDYLPRAGLGIGRLLVLLKLHRHGDLFGDLMTGADTVTRRCNQDLSSLARRARSGAPAAHFDRLRGADLLAELRADPACADFVAAFDDFLAEYGHKETVSPLLMSSPTWVDAPQTVLDLIAASPVAEPDRDVAAEAERRLFADPRAVRFIDRERWSQLIGVAQQGMAFREDTHFEFTRPLPLLRRAVTEIGERLAAAGALATGGDVLHLYWHEIEGLAPERLDDASRERIGRLIAARKEAREAIADRPMVAVSAPAADGDAVVTGTGASSGTATGPVRVIRSTDDFGRLRAGEVMVCPYTNPSWTPLFRLAIAVVVDSGGMGSHAAIVAREYGIPAIMGTGNGTSILTDGQQITVDGNTGRVVSA